MKSNKGFSLVELIVSFAILAIAGTAIYGLMSAGTNHFTRTGTDVGLQYEQQVVVNRLRDTLIEASNAINYNNDPVNDINELLVYSLEDMGVTSSGAHTHVYKYRVSKIFLEGNQLKKISALYDDVASVTTLSGVTATDDSLLGENIKDISFDLTEINDGKIAFEITFEQGEKEITSRQIVSLRNNVIDSTNSGEIFVSSTIMTESFINSVQILRNGSDAGAETIISVDGVNDIYIPFTYLITGNEYSESSYTYTGTWSLVSSVPGITVESDGRVKVEASVVADAGLVAGASPQNLATLTLTSVDDPSKHDTVQLLIQTGGKYPTGVSIEVGTTGANAPIDYAGYREYNVYAKVTYSDGHTTTYETDGSLCRWETNMDRVNPSGSAINPSNKLPEGCEYDVADRKFTAVAKANGMTATFKVTVKEPTILGTYLTAERNLLIEGIEEYIPNQQLMLSGVEDMYNNRGQAVAAVATWLNSSTSDFIYHWKFEPYGETWLSDSDEDKKQPDYARRRFEDTIYVDMTGKTITDDGWIVTPAGVSYLNVESRTWLDWSRDYKVKISCIATPREDGIHKIDEYAEGHLYGKRDARGVYSGPVEMVVTYEPVRVVLIPIQKNEQNPGQITTFVDDQRELRRASDGKNSANLYPASTLYSGNTVRMYRTVATGVFYNNSNTSALYLKSNDSNDEYNPQFNYYNSADALTPKIDFAETCNLCYSNWTIGFRLKMNDPDFKTTYENFDKPSGVFKNKPASMSAVFIARDSHGNRSVAYYLTGSDYYNENDLELTSTHKFKIKYNPAMVNEFNEVKDANFVEIYE